MAVHSRLRLSGVILSQRVDSTGCWQGGRAAENPGSSSCRPAPAGRERAQRERAPGALHPQQHAQVRRAGRQGGEHGHGGCCPALLQRACWPVCPSGNISVRKVHCSLALQLPLAHRRCKGGASVWAEATQGMAGSAAAVGQRRADAGRAAAQARKMWHLLRSRLRGDVSAVWAAAQRCSVVPCSAVGLCASAAQGALYSCGDPGAHTVPVAPFWTCHRCGASHASASAEAAVPAVPAVPRRSCCRRCGAPRCRLCA